MPGLCVLNDINVGWSSIRLISTLYWYSGILIYSHYIIVIMMKLSAARILPVLNSVCPYSVNSYNSSLTIIMSVSLAWHYCAVCVSDSVFIMCSGWLSVSGREGELNETEIKAWLITVSVSVVIQCVMAGPYTFTTTAPFPTHHLSLLHIHMILGIIMSDDDDVGNLFCYSVFSVIFDDCVF
jgi:hypothetical protein